MKKERADIISAAAAEAYAAREAGLTEGQYRTVHIVKRAGLYELILRTVVMEYTVYVDARTGWVPGIMGEPKTDFADLYQPEEYCAA